MKRYENPIKVWWQYCKEKQISVYDPDVKHILEFFTKQSLKVKSYSTLNVYRAAISLLMNNKLGELPEISRFFKGISNEKPRNAKYTATWDPNVVLTFLSNLFPNDSLTLEQLTKKLVTLLALTTAQRVQTLSKIKLENIHSSETGIKITITDKIKTSNRLRAQPLLDIPYFTQENICPAKTLQSYIRKTADIRPPNESYLLITFKKPYHTATTQSISRWIKDILEKSGIDTSIFTAHSTRHASTSAAARNGLNIETIRKAAGWSENSSVFAQFYNRPLVNKEVFASYCNSSSS